MITEITPQNIGTIKNRRLSAYAAIYLRIAEQFAASVSDCGLEFDTLDDSVENAERIKRLRLRGAVVRNDAKSVYLNALSPACEACRTGLGTATMFLSLKCHRNCFFCFNPNQEGYAHFQSHMRDAKQELNEIARSGQRLDHVALTGGEPLLHPAETIDFFRTANEKFPAVYKRLYTSGDQLDKELAAEFQRAQLHEIRFSIRLHDSPNAREHSLKQIALAREYISKVMVEMPVLPGALAEMKEILLDLDRLQITGINLLEFCFPLNNAGEYLRRGYRIKHRPYRVLYNYSYAGGLPIAGSESTCLDLLEWASEQQLKLGVHYCSLENKHTGEVYQRHYNRTFAPHFHFSQKDYFLKSAKVFGKDIQRVLPILEKTGQRDYQRNREHYFLEFHPRAIESLRGEEIEIGISTNVIEPRGDGAYLRELGLDWTTPQSFEFTSDI